MKRILIASPYIPYPLNSGGNIGVFSMINYFRQHYDITFTIPCYTKEEKKYAEELKILWSNVTILPFERPIRRRIMDPFYYRLQRLYHKLTFSRYSSNNPNNKDRNNLIESSLRYTSHIVDKNFVNYIDLLHKKDSFDLIQCEFYSMISMPAFLSLTIPIIFIHHELRFVKLKRELDALKNQDAGLNTIINLQTTYETSILKLFDKVVTVSEYDKILLSQYIDEEKLYASPLSIPIAERNERETYLFNNTLTFLGGDIHPPNKDGILWFLENCFPNLKIHFPELKLHIIGSWTDDFINKYTSNDVVFVGFVPDLKSALQNSIAIVPLRIGSGMRMKIIDAINHGVPFITTSVGVEGLDFKDNHDCFIGDTPEAFVEKLSTLIKSPILQQSFIEQSFTTLQDLYSFDKAIEKRKQLYDSLLS